MAGKSTAEVAKLAGVHRDTLLRWLRQKEIPEPGRNRHGWREFSEKQAQEIVRYAKGGDIDSGAAELSFDRSALTNIDWDFAGAKTSYLTHGIHPYPAKYIPQIPNALIQELSTVGDVVGDLFCGSGTTLLEALVLKRHAVGIDASPLACLISQAKTTPLSDDSLLALSNIATQCEELATRLTASPAPALFPSETFKSLHWRPDPEVVEFWFQPQVAEELAECLALAKSISLPARNVALTCFSSIVVTVSNQDSDTRYVRRAKQIAAGDVFTRYARSLRHAVNAIAELNDVVEERFTCKVVQSSVLEKPSVPKLDLVVCSPPYPNAYSYHLYHMTRMLWLGMDQPSFKKSEIGSHRKYSSKAKSAPDAETFENEFGTIFSWLKMYLKNHGFACFVIGDSTIRGEKIDNTAILSRAASKHGFKEAARLHRNLQDTKKAFNPAIGKIRTEHILILQNTGTTE